MEETTVFTGGTPRRLRGPQDAAHLGPVRGHTRTAARASLVPAGECGGPGAQLALRRGILSCPGRSKQGRLGYLKQQLCP